MFFLWTQQLASLSATKKRVCLSVEATKQIGWSFAEPNNQTIFTGKPKGHLSGNQTKANGNQGRTTKGQPLV